MSSRILALSVLCIVFLGLLGSFAFSPLDNLNNRVPDDAAYYFKIAENIVGGHGSTFDGVTATNGYHPAWMLALLPVASMVAGDPDLAFRCYLIYQLLMILVASLLLYWRIARDAGMAPVLLSVVLYVYVVFYKAANGMESGMLVLGLVLLYLCGWRLRVYQGFRRIPSLAFGALLGLVMLTRLDMVFLGAAVVVTDLAGAVIFRGGRLSRIKRVATITLGASAVVLPYLVTNYAMFESIIPISGLLKLTFPHASVSLTKLQIIGPIHLPFVLLALVYVPWAAITLARDGGPAGWTRYSRAATLTLGCATILHAANVVLFVNWGVFRWQFIPYALFACVAVLEWTGSLLSRPGKRLWTGGAFALSVAIAGVALAKFWSQIVTLPPYSWNVESYHAALWARENTDDEAVFAMKDAGTFAYFSGRRVVNLDGVVNDAAYQRALADGRLGQYLRDRQVDYIVQHAMNRIDTNLSKEIRPPGGSVADGTYDSVALRYLSVEHESFSDPIFLERTDEVYKSVGVDLSDDQTFVVWRYAELDASQDPVYPNNL